LPQHRLQIATSSSAGTAGFALHGESLDSLRSPFGPACGCYSASLRISLLAQKVTKEKARPASGSGLRPDFPPSGAAPGAGLQGASMPLYAGTPSPFAASMRLIPLRSTSTRPPDGVRTPSCLAVHLSASPVAMIVPTLRVGTQPLTLLRPFIVLY
jgi:hypothetical protein